MSGVATTTASLAAHAVRVQRAIERQNGVSPRPPIADFLISHEHERARLPGANAKVPEQVFVADDPEVPGLAVFIAHDVLERTVKRAFKTLAADAHSLDAHSLDAYSLDDSCVLAEGVSHFVYLMARAQEERQVTLFELELQAEVDKFVYLTDALGLPPGSAAQAALIEALFANYSLRENLSADEQTRYTAASRMAARFCSRLCKRAQKSKSREVILRAARDFFSLPLEGKLRKSAEFI